MKNNGFFGEDINSLIGDKEKAFVVKAISEFTEIKEDKIFNNINGFNLHEFFSNLESMNFSLYEKNILIELKTLLLGDDKNGN